MRKDYEMTDDDLAQILEACKPVPAIALQCGPISSPQENANRAWKNLGERMGFDYMTVKPNGKGEKHFSAEPLPPKTNTIDIVFDGPPGPTPGRFVEVERNGQSISLVEWVHREDGYWVLRISDPEETEA